MDLCSQMKWMLIGLVMCVAAHGIAQDTIAPPPKPKVPVVSNFVLQLDNRNERYYDEKGRMNGVRVGVEIFRRVRTGVGIYANNQNYRINFPDADPTYYEAARLVYNTGFIEPIWFRNFRWEFSTPLATGRGAIFIENFDLTTSVPTFQSFDTVMNVRMYDYAVQAQCKIFSWVGIGAGVGYRDLISKEDERFNVPFSRPYFDFRIKIYLGYVYKNIFKPEQIQAEQAYYDWRRVQRMEKFRNWFKNDSKRR